VLKLVSFGVHSLAARVAALRTFSCGGRTFFSGSSFRAEVDLQGDLPTNINGGLGISVHSDDHF